ncbi:MAG: dihydrofolate reductase [Nanoarchaeota archaeon]
MNLTLIAAVSENNVIGIDGKVPWYIPEDIKRFKELTLNHPVIMGRKTYQSIPNRFRPLEKRKNIVLSKNFVSEGEIYVARGLEEALDLTDYADSFIIGGASIYKIFLPFTSKIELTRVHEDYEGDAFFPDVDWNEWSLVNQERNTSHNGIDYSFLSYERKR